MLVWRAASARSQGRPAISACLRRTRCAVGARIARPRRKAASHGGCGSLKRPFVPPHPRLPLCPRGAVSRSETEGIKRTRFATADNPSVMAPPCHLPCVRGGLGRCVWQSRSGTDTQRTRDARPYGGDGAPGGTVGSDAIIGPHPPQVGKTPESRGNRRLGAMFLFVACVLRRGAVYCAQEG